MTLDYLSVHQAATSLLDCVCAGLNDLPGTFLKCPCRMFVSPGVPAADGCDTRCGIDEAPGQLTVHVARTYTTTRADFPRYAPSSPDSVRDARPCQPPPITAVDLVITLYRCVPGMSDNGCPPAPEALGAAALQTHADMMAIQQAVLCCYAETDTTQPRGRQYTLGQSATVGPRGDCIGIQQQVTVELSGCMPCPVPAP